MATTKTKKAAPQIDVRETFVSLQKDFGETGIPVAEKLKVLYALQQADNEIDKIKNLRGALPQEVAQIEDELAGLHSKVAHHEELIAGYEASIEENKNQIVDLDAEIAKYQEQLGNISNSREYDSISKEIENLGLLREIAQKHIGEARIAIGERRDAIDALGDRIAIREQDLAAKKEELETIVASTSEEEKALIITAENDNPVYFDDLTEEAATDDRVYLLNNTEAEQFFKSDADRRTEATAYAAEKGAELEDGFASWWLRSSGYDLRNASYVYSDGSIHHNGIYVFSTQDAVRPVIRIMP